MEKRLQRFIAMLAVFAMLFNSCGIPILAEGDPEIGGVPLCGMEEHSHSEDCYEKTLTCGLEETEAGEQRVFRAFRKHRHTDECYDEQGRLNCGIAEGEYYHSHNEFCYDEEGNLACGLEEVWPHEHTAECYRTEKKLICEKEEKEGHVHTDDCYTARQELTCGKEEEAGHQHSEECYQDTKILACELEENEEHTHTDDCYVTLHELACGETEREGHTHTAECYQKWNELTCGRQEEEGHTHSDSCYKTEEILVCDKQTEIHHHTAACRDEEGTLTCGLTEVPEFISTEDSWTTEGHRHTEACYENILTCGKTAHTHSEACYTEAGQAEDGTEKPAESGNTAETTEEPADKEVPIFETDGDILTAYHGEDETVTVPDGIREIGRSAFAGNRTLRTVILPDSTELISNYAFADCPELERVETSGQSRLTVIGNKAFRNDTKLDLSFAANVESIYGDAFEGISETPEEETPTETGEQEENLPEEDGQEAEGPESAPEPGADGEETGLAEELTGEEAGEEETDGETGEETSEEGEAETEEPADETADITLAAESELYAVTVSFPADAGIPEGTEVTISDTGDGMETPAEEMAPDRKSARGGMMKSAGIRRMAAEEPRADIPSLTVWDESEEAPEIPLYRKTLDISLVSEGEKIEPEPGTAVTVTVRLPGIEAGQAVEVRHLTDGGTELLDSTNDAGTITFTTSSFSLFEFTSRAQQLSTWVTGQTANTFYGKTTNQEPQASAVSLTDVTEGLEVLEAYTVTKSSDLWMAIRRIADIALGKLESIVLYTVEDGKLGAIVRENISLSDVLRFNLGELNGYALVRDSGLRHRTEELGNITLDGMMPKNAAAEATDVTAEYAESAEYEETVAAYDICVLNNGEAYQPEENPITVRIYDENITAALEEGKTIRLWHIPDEGEREEVSYTLEDGVLSFEATGFSAYVFSASIEKEITIDGKTWKVTVTYGEDAEIPEGAELSVQEAEAADYQEAAAAAWNWTEDSYAFYTKFLDISIVKDGEKIEPKAPVSVSIQLTDVEAGAEALRVVHFSDEGAEAIDSQASEDGTLLFETESFSVFGFGNALQPLAAAGTEEASLTILGFGGETQLNAADIPQVEEGLEVLGAYTLGSGENRTKGAGEETNENETAGEGTWTEQQEGPAGNYDNSQFWIKAELKDSVALADTECVTLCAMDGDNVNPVISRVTADGQIVQLEAANIALIKDTGYRHLSFALDPNGENQKPIEQKYYQAEEERADETPEAAGDGEDTSEGSTDYSAGDAAEENKTGNEAENTEEGTEGNTSDSRVVILDGMMPKDAEAAAFDMTEAFAEHEYPAPEEEAEEETGEEETTEEAQEEPEENTPAEEPEEEGSGEETAEEETETKRTTLAAYEITILNNEIEYQPDAQRPIRVEIADSRITGSGYTELWHIRDDGTEEQITEFAIEAGKIEFNACSFSVYAIVEGPQPVPDPSTEVNTLDDIVENQGYLFSIARNNSTNYMTSNPASDELQGSTNKTDAETWYFESAGETGKFYIYCIKNDTNYYVYAPNPESSISLDTNNRTLFTVEETTNAPGTFYIYHVPETQNRALSVRSNRQFFLEKRNNGANANERVVLTKVIVQDDPYELDGKKYGLMRYNSGISGYALTVNESGSLAAQEMLVKENPLNRKENLYVAKDSNISMWQFNTEGGDLYTLSTDVNGTTKFLKINSNNISLADTESAASRIQVIPGTGSNEGKVRLKDSSNGKTIYLNNNKFAVNNDNAGSANQYMSFAVLSELAEEDFVPYSAQKVSIADQAQQVQNGDQIVIYTRRWNDTEKHYDFYVVDHNGDLVRAYEEGGSIQWVGTKINTAVWHFTEYYWEGTNEPNYYYDLKNDYTNQFLFPQVSGQILSDDPVGINLNGRRYNDYYSIILAWDDPTYAYAGIKTKSDSSSVETCRIGKAEDFYFAKMEVHTTDTLTPVSTVDHTAYGITMRMVDFNNGTYSPQGTVTDRGQHAVMGDTNRYSATFDGTKDLLTTDLKSNGYPVATHTGRSLSDLFAGASEVNHLFLDSTYYGSGYFSYDSSQNFASLKDDNNFVVYRELGTDDSSSKESLKHGNFYPYNDLTPGLFASVNPENLYTATQKELNEDYPRKHEKLYLVRNTDWYFGMEISASFVQTPNGKDAWNHDIIYEFVGDDDFWLYVDGELIVDLGGIHSALGAKVNYATGTVDVGSFSGNAKHTTLYEIFKENYKSRNGVGEDDAGLQAYLSEKFTQKNGNWVFKDYSTHTMRIFYMERGGGASNLKMRFNLASVNPNQILLTKEVSGIADAEFLTTKFPYQIWYQPPREVDYVTMVQGTHDTYGYRVTYKNTNERVEFHSSYTIGDATYANVFMLKPGQTVEINTPDEIGNYRIVECGIPGNVYNRYGSPGNYTYHALINDDIVAGEVKGAEAGDPLLDYATSDAKVTERAHVVFTNHVNEDYLRTLSITKKLLAEDGTTELTEADDPTGFRYRLYLGEHLGYYNMKDYYVKSPDGAYCQFTNGHFISTGKSLFENLTDEEKDHVTFTTSPAGSIDKIPAGYTVEIRDLPVGTKFKIEERKEDLPEGYTLKQYERDEENNPYIYFGNVYNEGEIQEGSNARLFVVNQRGWGLTVKKLWTDKYFTLSHDPVYVAIYTGPEDNDLLPGSVREIRHPSTSAYYYIDELIAGKRFEDYSACEVILENPETNSDGVVTSYDSISRVTEGVPIAIGAVNRDGETVDPIPKYLVTYDKGEAEGSTDSIHNVRTDIITNQREGGIIIRLYDWIQDWNTQAPDKPKMLPGGIFRLEKGGEPVGEGTYTSDSRGLITVLYDFETDTDYTLTQISAPAGYQGLTEPLTFRIPEAKDNIIIADTAIQDWYTAHTIDQTTGDNLIAYVNLKNKPYTLRAVKIDPDPNDRKVLPGAHFALYRQYTSQEGNLVKDYYPIPGYEDKISGLDGVVDGIDQTLAPWTYYLTETEAPTNYDKVEDEVLFTISELGYVSTVPAGWLTEETAQDGTTEYTINIPNKKLVLIPPVLYVSKKVEGNEEDFTKPFRFTISGLIPNKAYVYQRFETENGTDYHEQSGAAALGFITVDANGVISFDLMHYEKIGISLPYDSKNFTVSENVYTEYTTSYVMDEAESVTGNSILIDEEFTEDILIAFTNTSENEKIVAPTSFTTRRTPYFLLMLAGFILIVLCGIGWHQKRRTAGVEDDPPDPGQPPRNSNGPPGGRKQFDAGGWANRGSGFRITDKGSATSQKSSRNPITDPLIYPTVRGTPPCPRANPWTWTQGPTGKRGDPGG